MTLPLKTRHCSATVAQSANGAFYQLLLRTKTTALCTVNQGGFTSCEDRALREILRLD